ncbi:MAG: RNA polymerase factor sigma-54 [Spirochaetaceae bacterium]|jgi:RNA polymerase sigma-54 factor|nr:RNA polymerase factor sigma-54 [Spirochaetaceae bacterium]
MMRTAQALLPQQRLGLKLSPNMLQSIKIMEMPLLDLREAVELELERNPALEAVKDNSVIRLGEPDSRGEESSYFETSSDPGYPKTGDFDDEGNRAFIEGALARPETLQDYLLSQLRLQPVSQEIRAAGELIIQNLSPDGFHKEPLELLLAKTEPPAAKAALELVQRLDPCGCAVSDYRQSLFVQASLRFGEEAPEIEALIPFLDALERGKFAQTARALKKNEDELLELFEKLKSLSPFPGRPFAYGVESSTRYIIPDLRVKHSEDGLKIIINNESIPVLGISPSFSQNENSKNAAEREFVRKKLSEARSFLSALSRRKLTLLRVGREIIRFQHDFFEHGPRYIAPLVLSDIAEKLDLHEATISRAVNGKYMETEWGIYELRRFFTNSIAKTGAAAKVSKESVKELIREIVSSESSSLTDTEIVSRLAGRGINLARRTIAKYRSQLDLPSSYRR